jgi:hypothetical protein
MFFVCRRMTPRGLLRARKSVRANEIEAIIQQNTADCQGGSWRKKEGRNFGTGDPTIAGR